MTAQILGIGYAAIVAVSAAGLGSALAKALRITPNIGERGILGLLSFGFLNLTLHFFVPLNTLVEGTLLAAGLALLLFLRKSLPPESLWVLALAAGLLVVLGITAAQEELVYDAGLYYIPAMRWNREFPITLGLANLHGRLGFNSFYLMLTALITRPQFAWVPNVVAGSFFGAACLQRANRIEASPAVGTVASAFVLLAGAVYALTTSLASFNPEQLVRGLFVYWTVLALEFLTREEGRATNAPLLVLLGGALVMVKLSALPVVPATAVVLRLRKQSWWPKPALALAACMLLLWEVRAVLLTGCLLYPVGASCVAALPWTVAAEQAKWHEMCIRAWARAPGVFNFGLVLSNWDWLARWFPRLIRQTWVILAAAGCVAGFLGLAYARAVRRTIESAAAVIAGLLCASLVWWFFVAPDYRFAWGYVVSLALLGFSIPLSLLLNRASARAWPWSAVGRVVVCLVGLRAVWLMTHLSRPVAEVPTVAAYQIAGPDGNAVWMPRLGDQCWDHTLPCTAYLHPEWWSRVRWRSHWTADPALAPPPGWIHILAEDSGLKEWEIDQPDSPRRSAIPGGP